MEKQYSNIEFRQFDDEKLEIVCKVNNYKLSKKLRGKNGKFREQIPREVWQRAIDKNRDIKFYYNHKPYFELAKTIELRAEEDGIYLYATLKENERGLYQAIKDGLIKGMSFGFSSLKDNFNKVGYFIQRTIEDMEVFEVSILDVEPAYFGTLAEVRNLELPCAKIEILRKKLNLYKHI